MSSVFVVSSGSLTLTGSVYAAFLAVDKYASEEFKNSIISWIKKPSNGSSLKTVDYLNEAVNNIFPDYGFSFYSFFKNTIIVLSLFLVLLLFFILQLKFAEIHKI